jgi:tripartite-type tricarboxylate transporter receptor subunit TctC
MREISIGRTIFDLDRDSKAMRNKLVNIPRALRRLPHLLFLAIVITSSAATSQGYPNKPIHIIVPYAPGGVVDATARMLAERLAPLLRQTFIVDNKAGAAGKIAAEFVSRAEPDGYTIFYTTAADLTLLQGRPSATEAIRNLTPITSAISPVGAITARSGLGLDSMEKLLAYVKSNPGKLTYGTAGYGSSQHLMGEYFKQQGYEMVHVPFNGIGPAMAALAGGQIDLAITNLASSLPLAEDGRVKILALPQSEPFEDRPDIPPITKAMPGFAFRRPSALYAFYGPPGLPRPIVAKLADEIGKAVMTAEMKAKLKALSIVPIVTSPDEFAAMVQEIGTTFQTVIKSANIKLE